MIKRVGCGPKIISFFRPNARHEIYNKLVAELAATENLLNVNLDILFSNVSIIGPLSDKIFLRALDTSGNI